MHPLVIDSTFNAILLLAVVILFTAEIVAIVMKNLGYLKQSGGQTISHKIIRWIKRKPKTRRAIIGLLLVWLLYHWVFQSF